MKPFLAAIIISLPLQQSVKASLIGFDDITAGDLAASVGQVPSGKGGGLGYENFYVSLSSSLGAVSSPACIYSVPQGPAFFGSLYAFTLNSAYLTSGQDGLQVEVVGTYRGDVLYDDTYTLSSGVPTLCNFNYAGIDTAWFRKPGTKDGDPDSFVGFALDNLVINENSVIPEPGTFLVGLLLVAPVCLGAAWNTWKKASLRGGN